MLLLLLENNIIEFTFFYLREGTIGKILKQLQENFFKLNYIFTVKIFILLEIQTDKRDKFSYVRRWIVDKKLYIINNRILGEHVDEGKNNT